MLSEKFRKTLSRIPKLKIHLPHINRKFTAGFLGKLLKYGLLSGLTALIIVNLGYRLVSQNPEAQYQLEILKNPFRSEVHERLANWYFDRNQSLSQREFKLADEYFTVTQQKDNQVLGIDTSPLARWNKLVNSQQQITTDIVFWEKIKKIYPDYLFADINLSKLYYQKQDFAKSRTILDKLIEENPGFTLAQELQKEIRSQ